MWYPLEAVNLQRTLVAGGLIFQPVAFPRQHGDAIWTSLSYAEEKYRKENEIYSEIQICSTVAGRNWLENPLTNLEKSFVCWSIKKKVNKKVTLVGVNLG